jgi:hypothetical protein
MPCCQAAVPTVNDASGPVRLELGGACLAVEPSCPDAHGGSIGALALEVDPAHGLGEPQADPLGVPPYGLAV